MGNRCRASQKPRGRRKWLEGRWIPRSRNGPVLAYGKSIQKPIKTFLQFVKKEEYAWFVKDRYYQIHCDNVLDNGNHLIELTKQKANQFNNVLFGVTVLSMSKRIMNEVMCLAEDLGIQIYYQDTDSRFECLSPQQGT